MTTVADRDLPIAQLDQRMWLAYRNEWLRMKWQTSGVQDFAKADRSRKIEISVKNVYGTRGKQGTTACDTTNELLQPLRREDGKIAKQGSLRRRSRVVHAGFQLRWDSHLLHQNSATTIKSFLNESIGDREML